MNPETSLRSWLESHTGVTYGLRYSLEVAYEYAFGFRATKNIPLLYWPGSGKCDTEPKQAENLWIPQ